MVSSRAHFIPELARNMKRQIYISERFTVNFVMSSVNRPNPEVETWESLRPKHSILYPTASQFRDLSEANAKALVDFYDSVQGIDDILKELTDEKKPSEFNAWNVLMQRAEKSLAIGEVAIQQFCPDREFDPTSPASGTLIQNIKRAREGTKAALDAHEERLKEKGIIP